jgi:hypothetical protein
LISCPWISSFVTVEIQLGARPHSIISTMVSLKPWDYLSSGYQKWSLFLLWPFNNSCLQ